MDFTAKLKISVKFWTKSDKQKSVYALACQHAISKTQRSRRRKFGITPKMQIWVNFHSTGSSSVRLSMDMFVDNSKARRTSVYGSYIKIGNFCQICQREVFPSICLCVNTITQIEQIGFRQRKKINAFLSCL